MPPPCNARLVLAVIGCVVVAVLVSSHRPRRRVRGSGLDAWICDGLLAEEVLRSLERATPSTARASSFPATFRPIGSRLSLMWNAPPDETYWKQGVVVDDAPRLDERTRSALETSVGRLVGLPLRMIEARSKRHVARSPGVWLHTDRQTGTPRRVHALVYLTDLSSGDGGACHLFSHETTSLPAEHRAYVRGGVRIGEFDRPLVATLVGGEWSRGKRRFVPRQRVVPKRGRVVVMDCAKAENVHSVTAMRTDRDRALFEAWFGVARPV